MLLRSPRDNLGPVVGTLIERDEVCAFRQRVDALQSRILAPKRGNRKRDNVPLLFPGGKNDTPSGVSSLVCVFFSPSSLPDSVFIVLPQLPVSLSSSL